jgi:hypothetical protein
MIHLIDGYKELKKKKIWLIFDKMEEKSEVVIQEWRYNDELDGTIDERIKKYIKKQEAFKPILKEAESRMKKKINRRQKFVSK